ncbi:MAG: type I glutamate--ammonia ligase [bacterium]
MENSIFERIKKEAVEIVNLKFVDLLGRWQDFSVPVSFFTSDNFAEGTGFDGSSIKGFNEIQQSDMLLFPDLQTAFVDSFTKAKTLNLICDVREPGNGPFEFDPRQIAKRAESYLLETCLADKSFWGPEPEFFIFDKLTYSNKENGCSCHVDSEEAWWRSDDETVLGNTIAAKEGYFPAAPSDRFEDLRTTMTKNLERAGIAVEKHHHEVATAGQAEIDIKYDTLLQQADNIMKFKYIVKNTARAFGKIATFMPKPLFGDNGSGMHVHISLWKEGRPLFFKEGGYANLSEEALWFIGGLFNHIEALMAFCAPTTNSYKRLVPGFEAPTYLAYSKRNRSVAVRVPAYHESPASKRIEFRPPDPTANPYLAFSAILLAGLDGIKKKILPGQAVEENIFAGKVRPDIKTIPATLQEAVEGLKKDKDFLLAGDVFSENFIAKWAELKEAETKEMLARPHPFEFFLYHNY